VSPRIKQNRKLEAEIRKLEIVQTPPMSCPYRNTHHYKVNLSNKLIFPVPTNDGNAFGGGPDTINSSCQAVMNMCRNGIQL